ncbi:hypothetical protein IAT40_001821 [Kwoniella sp. CBS 6097]
MSTSTSTITYACNHLEQPRSTLPPSFPSSSPSYHALENLYFCEECDAVRCDTCVAVEVASYFCPNCLFDVPSANVRADKNRCARSCFSCPQCDSSLSVQASDIPSQAQPQAGFSSGTSLTTPGPPYVLACSGCKWSSRQVGWTFDKPTGIALQLQKMNTQAETVQSEFDALKDHLESYIASNVPAPSPARSTRTPSRHISHLTQMAAKALHRDVGGIAASSARSKPRAMGSGGGGGSGKEGEKERYGWDEIEQYKAKGSWKYEGLMNGLKDVETMGELQESGPSGMACLGKRWNTSWASDRMSSAVLPQRIPLQTKLTKRCPHPSCRHLLIQPDTKSVRMKIKMVALNYLPLIEFGRRRRRIPSNDIVEISGNPAVAAEEAERRHRDRRRTRGPNAHGGGGKEEDESMDKPLKAGEVYTFHMALTNPLFDPIQIRLTQPHQPRTAPAPSCTLFIPTPHFTINALKDAWAYDEDDEDEDMVSGLGSGSGSGTGTNTGTLGRKSRLSILAGGSSSNSKKGRESGVEKKGNMSKVAIELEVAPHLTKGDRIEFDLEIRYTYRADDAGTPTHSGSGEGGDGKSKEEYKTFTFWVRVLVGEVG